MLDPARLAADAAAAIEALANATATWSPAVGGGPYAVPVILDSPAVDALSGEVLSRDWRMRYLTSALPGLADSWDDETVVIGAASYRVRAVRRLADGLIAAASLTPL